MVSALVVRRDQNSEAQRRPRVVLAIGQLAGRQVGVLDEPDRRWTERGQQKAAQPAHLRRQGSGYAPVAGEDPQRGGRVQGGQPDEDGGRAGSSGQYEREGGRCRRPREEVGRRCPSDALAERSMRPAATRTRVAPMSATDSQLSRATRRRSWGLSTAATARDPTERDADPGDKHRWARSQPGFSTVRSNARAALSGALARPDPRHRRREDGGRRPRRADAARERPPADLPLPARGSARRSCWSRARSGRALRTRARDSGGTCGSAERAWARTPPGSGTSRPRARRRSPGLLGFRWDALDRWMEEDEENSSIARDPYHRVRRAPHGPRVRISLDGVAGRGDRSARVIFETGLPPRWYVPLEDVREELLLASDCGPAAPIRGSPRSGHCGIGDRLEQEYRLVLQGAAPRRRTDRRGRCVLQPATSTSSSDVSPGARPLTPWSPGVGGRARGRGRARQSSRPDQ